MLRDSLRVSTEHINTLTTKLSIYIKSDFQASTHRSRCGCAFHEREKRKKTSVLLLFLSRFNCSPHAKHSGLRQRGCSVRVRTSPVQSLRVRWLFLPVAVVKMTARRGGILLRRCASVFGDRERTRSLTPGDFLSTGLAFQHSPSAAPWSSPPT